MMKASIVAFELSSLVKEQLEISAQRRRCIGEVSDGAEQKRYYTLLDYTAATLFYTIACCTILHGTIIYYITQLCYTRVDEAILYLTTSYYTTLYTKT